MLLIKNRLDAGFFSNLNAVINWYWYSMRTEIPIYVHWDGILNKNIFDLFFSQKYEYKSHFYENNAFVQHSALFTDQIKDAFKEDIGDVLSNKYNNWFFCQGKVYSETDFYKLRLLYNHVYNENLKLNQEFINNNQPLSNKTLGINYRFIHFYQTESGTPFKSLMSADEYNKKYMDEIELIFETGKFDKIYLASSQRPFFELCLEKFKDKLLYLPMKRLEADQEEYVRGVSLTEEYTNVIKDVINLTKCDHLLVSPSNIMFGTLYINPNVTFKVFDFLKNSVTG